MFKGPALATFGATYFAGSCAICVVGAAFTFVVVGAVFAVWVFFFVGFVFDELSYLAGGVEEEDCECYDDCEFDEVVHLVVFWVCGASHPVVGMGFSVMYRL